MMARIRTVKPEFFTSYKLFKAEQEAGLPLRLGFEGLWCQADRDGRFKWIPEELKLGVLPYDEVDFSRVLDALWTRGFIEKYTEDGEEFGWIPSFLEHQVINNREKESVLPIPNENNILTREARVNGASVTRRARQVSGKERKGKEGKGTRVPDTFDLTEDLIAWARQENIGVNLQAETAKFKDYEFKTPKSDWKAAWRNWMRKANEMPGAPKPSSPSREFPS